MTETSVVTARIPDREIAIAAYTAGMTDASKAEVVRYCMLRLAGHGHEEARNKVLALRVRGRRVAFSDEGDIQVSVRLPTEWVQSAQDKAPDMKPSELFRYSVIRVAEPSHEHALNLARRKTGRPAGSKNKNGYNRKPVQDPRDEPGSVPDPDSGSGLVPVPAA